MIQLHSDTPNGPLTNKRNQKFFSRIDPTGMGQLVDYEFELEVFDAYETESFSRIVVCENVLKECATYNDFYSFGSSRNEAIKDAEHEFRNLKSATLDIEVITRLIKKVAVINKDKEPFYIGSVCVFYRPYQWRMIDDQEVVETEEFIVWRNGQITEQGQALSDQINQLSKRDQAQKYRKQKSRSN